MSVPTSASIDAENVEESLKDARKWNNLLCHVTSNTLPTASSQFPAGTLSSLRGTGDIHGVITFNWTYTTESPAAAVTITLTIFSSLRTALAGYAAKSEKLVGQGKQRDEWPRGFPDRNDYDCVEACCLFTSTTEVGRGSTVTDDGMEVAWVQRSPVVASMLVDEDDEDDEEDDHAAKEGRNPEPDIATMPAQEESKGECYIVSLWGGNVAVLKDMADGMWAVVYEGSAKEW
jgi:hypothetical protein